MKNTVKILGVIALVAVIGFSMAACKDDDPTSAVFKGIDSAANLYELAVKKGSRATYSAKEGDDFVLTVTPPNGTGKKSQGGVKQSVKGGFQLQSANNPGVFNVAVNGETIVAIAGSITYTDGTTIDTQAALTPAKGKTIPAASNGITTIASGETLVYDKRIANQSAAKKVDSFPYAMAGDQADGFHGDPLASVVPNTSVTVSGGKVTLKAGTPVNDVLSDEWPDGTGGHDGAKYFGNPTDVMMMINIAGPVSNTTPGLYGLLCLFDDRNYANLIYLTKVVTLKAINANGNTIEIVDLTAEAGWNYLIATENKIGAITIRTFAVSKIMPAGYKWTVIDGNFPLSLRN